MIRRIRRICACVLAFAFVATPARAQTRVVVSVRAEDAPTDALTARVVHELRVRGFSVEVVALESAESGSRDLYSSGASLALSIEMTAAGRVRIEIADADGDRRGHRLVEADGDGHGPSVIALAAAELLDAVLIESGDPLSGVESSPPAAASSAAERDAAPVPFFEAHMGMLWPVHTPAPVGTATVAVGLRPTARIGISTEGTVPLHALAARVERARLRTYPFSIGVRTDVDVLPARTRARLDLQAGISAIALRVEVDPAPNVVAHPRTLWTTGAMTGLHLHGPVRGPLHLGGSVRVVVPFEDITLWTDDEPAQRLGPVWIGAAVSIGARW